MEKKSRIFDGMFLFFFIDLPLCVLCPLLADSWEWSLPGDTFWLMIVCVPKPCDYTELPLIIYKLSLFNRQARYNEQQISDCLHQEPNLKFGNCHMKSIRMIEN